MISAILYAFDAGLGLVKKHPQILFALFLVVILPLAFLYSGNEFLKVGQSNQDRLQKDKIGVLHDSFVSIIYATEFDTKKVQTEINRFTESNPDLTKFRIAYTSPVNTEIKVIAAKDTSLIGTSEEGGDLYRLALTRPDESIVVPFVDSDSRKWQAFRAVLLPTGETYYIFTETDLSAIDKLFDQRKQTAYYVLAVFYLFLLALAYWLVKVTNYQYLYAEVKKANEMKDLFTNMIAHELRSPLTAIRGYSSMLEESAQSDEQLKYSSRIKISSERLLNIVNDLLDVARIQSGKLAVEIAETDLNELVTNVIAELGVSAQEKSITLNFTNDKEALVMVDKNRLHQVLVNIVSNSIKYTKEGEINIVLIEKTKFIELRVQDTGMGISAEDQNKLFAPFFRVKSDDVSKITGTGLGMWITKQLVELMGATIFIESIKGVGTHVVVKLPKQVGK